MRRALALAGLLAAACGRGGGGEGEILRALGDDVDLVIVAAPGTVGGTWVERAALLAAPAVPACVRERARVADAVVVTWSQTDGTEGTWSLVMNGGAAVAPGCDGLTRDGALAWYGGDPRGGAHRFFASTVRKRRWRALGDTAVRVLGDVEVQSGIVLHADGRLDPRDGVDAHAVLRFDERAAADGFDQLLERWNARLDRERLGGAWPAFSATLERDPRDPGGTTLLGELRLPGAGGEEAMIFAVTALLSGSLGAEGVVCPWIADAWKPRLSCTGAGRFVIDGSLRDQMIDDPTMIEHDARVVPSMKNGAANGFKLYAIRPTSLVAALGFQNGDRVISVGGATVTTADEAVSALDGLSQLSQFSVEVERRGGEVTLRYEVR